MSLDPAALTSLPVAVWLSLALGLFFGTGLVMHKIGIQIFSRIVFPVILVFGVATIATYVKLPGITFNLADYLPSLRGMEVDLAKAFGAGFIVAVVLRTLWSQFLVAQGESGERDTKRWRSARSLYYETAIRLGVLTANADDDADAREFVALEDVFELNVFNAPNAKKLYADQLQTPRAMTRILRPFKRRFAPASSACETLIFGMATIAVADQKTTASELGLVRMAAAELGLSPSDTNRLLKAAGVGQTAAEHRQTRVAHLSTLGLKANASPKQIAHAHARLSSKYAPKRLLLLALPDAERQRVETLRTQIDSAYEALLPAA